MYNKLKIISMNCRGMGNSQKRKDVLNYLNAKHASIYCLQDTHFVPEIESVVKQEWDGTCFLQTNAQTLGGWRYSLT